jgi:hypothetical protein
MAMKTNFEDSNVISSPFVDEIANPGPQRSLPDQLRHNADIVRSLSAQDVTPPSARISAADRNKKITKEQRQAQATVDRAELDHADPSKNKGRKRAEGQF